MLCSRLTVQTAARQSPLGDDVAQVDAKPCDMLNGWRDHVSPSLCQSADVNFAYGEPMSKIIYNYVNLNDEPAVNRQKVEQIRR